MHAAEWVRSKMELLHKDRPNTISLMLFYGYFSGWLSGSHNGHIMKQMHCNRALCEPELSYVSHSLIDMLCCPLTVKLCLS